MKPSTAKKLKLRLLPYEKKGGANGEAPQGARSGRTGRATLVAHASAERARFKLRGEAQAWGVIHESYNDRWLLASNR